MSSSSALPAPARPTWRPLSASAPVSPGSAWPSPARPSGWRACWTRSALLVVDEVGYIPFDAEAAKPPALLIERQGTHSVIGASDTPLGSVSQLEVGARATRMDRGDRLIITADGRPRCGPAVRSASAAS